MQDKPVIVIFFNDWKVYPKGVNAGGGESATMALARAMLTLGHRVIACANLPEGECVHNGIEFWNFGKNYNLKSIAERLRGIGQYYCICATLVHPVLHLIDHQNCLSRILINHAPSSHSSGLEPSTVMELIDKMLCVSEAQRSLILSRNVQSSKINVVRNGFDPDVFSYSGPQARDWHKLIFIGRIEPPKGIHIIVQVFGELKKEFPRLTLDVFGDESYWPEFISQKHELMRQLAGLKFWGKVPQRELSQHLRSAGLLVFPSISFETAGLAVIDAQASGCPVIATAVGGVPEYVFDGVLGELVYEKTPEALYNGIVKLLRNPERLAEMSRAGEQIGRNRTWVTVAQEVIAHAEIAAANRASTNISSLPESLQRMSNCSEASPNEVLEAHEHAALTEVYSDVDLDRAISIMSNNSWPYLVRGIRNESSGDIDKALSDYQQAAKLADCSDWQPFFRMALVYAERNALLQASDCAKEVLARNPKFPLRNNLEKLISLAGR